MSLKSAIDKLYTEYSKTGLNPLFIRKCYLKILQIGEESLIKLIPYGVFSRHVLDKLLIKPSYLDIETTNICNANCFFCAYRYMRRPKGVMDEAIFKKIVKDYVDIGGGDVGLTPVPGEPLLDPKILERIKFLRSFANIRRIDFDTNGILIGDFDIKDLLTSGIDYIAISFGGVNKEEYKETFGVDAFERAYSNIVKLGKINRELNYPVSISISFRTFKKLSYFEKTELYRKLTSDFRVEYKYNYHSWGGVVKTNDLKGEVRMMPLEAKRKEPCSLLYSGLRICWNGDVTPCWCGDVDADLKVGNIAEDCLIDIWRGEKLAGLRNSFFNGTPPLICQKCEHYKGLKSLRSIISWKIASENHRYYLETVYLK